MRPLDFAPGVLYFAGLACLVLFLYALATEGDDTPVVIDGGWETPIDRQIEDHQPGIMYGQPQCWSVEKGWTKCE